MAGSADNFGLIVEGVCKLVVLDAFDEAGDMAAVGEQMGLVLVGQGVNGDLGGSKVAYLLVGLLVGHDLGGDFQILFLAHGAGGTLCELFGCHFSVVAHCAPLVVLLGRHDAVASGALGLALVVLLVAADTADGRLAVGLGSDVRGMHGAFKRDALALGAAGERVAVRTGLRIAGVVTGCAVFDCLFVDEMVEHGRFHAADDSLSISCDGKHDQS